MNDASETIATRNCPRREATVTGDIKRRFVVGECLSLYFALQYKRQL